MSRGKWIVLIGLLPGLASAQSKKVVPDNSVQQMYEEIEIFQILLKRNMARVTGFPHGMPGSQWWSKSTQLNAQGYRTDSLLNQAHWAHPHGELDASSFQSVYLKDQGVVYSVQMPMPLTDPMKVSTKEKEKPLSEWEKARRELQGEKTSNKDKKKPQDPESLSEIILKVMARNGQHLSRLSGDEKLTVAVSFQPSSAQVCLNCHAAPSSLQNRKNLNQSWHPLDNTLRRSGSVRQNLNAALRTAGGPVIRIQSNPSPTAASKNADEKQRKVTSVLLLVDLHIKHKRYEDAIKSLNEAQKLLSSLYDLNNLRNQSEVEQVLKAVEVANKLAQIYLRTGQTAMMQKQLDLAATLAQKATGASVKQPSKEKKIAIPSRLILSAPKKLLDQVGSGKMAFSEFREKVSIRFLSFPGKK